MPKGIIYKKKISTFAQPELRRMDRNLKRLSRKG